MKTIVKGLLLLALAAVPFLSLSTPAHADVGVYLGGGGHHHRHHHHHYHRHY